jgi:hypothetical protein
MTEISELPGAREVPAEIALALEREAELRILRPARRRGYELRRVGCTVYPKRREIHRSAQGTWLFVNHCDDPATVPYGGKLVVPDDCLDPLNALRKAGVEPDLCWIAHELHPGWQEGDSLEDLIPPPRHIREKNARLLKRITALHTLAGRGANLVESGANRALDVLASDQNDPVVLGGVMLPNSDAHVCWVVLAQWIVN